MDLKKLWRNKNKIREGVLNTIFPTLYTKRIAASRLAICTQCAYMGNQCEVPGTGPCCNICGCSLKFKLNSLTSNCGLEELGEPLKWKAVKDD